MHKKKTNNFQYTIFGIDLFVKYIVDLIKKNKNNKKAG